MGLAALELVLVMAAAHTMSRLKFNTFVEGFIDIDNAGAGGMSNVMVPYLLFDAKHKAELEECIGSQIVLFSSFVSDFKLVQGIEYCMN